MKKIVILLVVLLALTFAFSVVFAGYHDCQICDMPGSWTGQIKTEWGHMFHQYKCPNNHYWWERQD